MNESEHTVRPGAADGPLRHGDLPDNDGDALTMAEDRGLGSHDGTESNFRTMTEGEPGSPSGGVNDDAITVADLPPAGTGGRQYKRLSRLGSGGMGDVYEVRDIGCRRNVAMKFIRKRDTRSALVNRFAAEARITAQLEHPNIVPVHDFGLDADNNLFYTMKRIRGTSLQEILVGLVERDPEMVRLYPLSRLLSIFQRACDALAFAHSRGVIHRDIKPDNIMVGDFGEVLLVDWGIAKITGDDRPTQPYGADPTAPPAGDAAGLGPGAGDGIEASSHNTFSGTVLGTPGYMSIEQAEGRVDEIDGRSDIFSLGVTLYVILTLRHPMGDCDRTGFFRLLEKGEIPCPSDQNNSEQWIRDPKRYPPPVHCPRYLIPPSLSAVAMKAMATAPKDRYQTVTELQADIERYQSGFATAAEDAGALRVILLLIRRHRLLSAGLVIIAALSTFFVVELIASERRARNQQLLAEQNAQLARENEATAERASKEARQRLAEGLIAQGDALGSLDKWHAAKSKYAEASAELARIGLLDFPALAGLLQAYDAAPAVLLHRRSPWQITSVARSHDDRVAVIAGIDGSVAVLDLLTFRETAAIKGTGTPVLAVAISPDHNWIYCGKSDGSVDGVDTRKGSVTRAFPPHDRWINSLAMSSSGKRLLAGSEDGRVTLWNTISGDVFRTVTAPSGSVKCTLDLGDDDRFAIAGSSGAIWIMSAASGQYVQTLHGHSHPVVSMNAFENGKVLVSGDAEGALIAWDIVSGNQIDRRQGDKASVLDSTYDSVRKSLTCAYRNASIIHWRHGEPTPVARFSGYSENVVAGLMLGAEPLAVAVVDNSEVMLVRTPGHRESSVFVGHTGSIECIAITPDGRLAVSGGWDTDVFLWDVDTGVVVQHFAGHQRAVTGVAISADATTVVSSSLDGTARVWDPFSGTCVRIIAPERGPITQLCADTAAAKIYLGFKAGGVSSYDTQNGDAHKWSGDAAIAATALDLSDDGSRLLIASAAGIRLVTVGSGPGGDAFFEAADGFTSSCAVLANDGSSALCGSTDGRAIVIDAETGTVTATIETGNALKAVAFGPEKRFIFTAGRGAGIRLWNVRDGAEQRRFHGHAGRVTTLTTGQSGGILLSGGRDKHIRIWDFSRPRHFQDQQSVVEDACRRLQAAPDDVVALRTLGEWYASHQLWSRAATMLEKAERGGSAISALTLAFCYWRVGDPAAAAERFRMALANSEAPATYIALCRNALIGPDRESSTLP